MAKLSGNAIFFAIIGTLVIVPGVLWYLTADPIWALGWLLLLVFGM